MLQIKLAHQQDVSNAPLGHDVVVSMPRVSEETAWEAGRGCWVMKASRAINEEEDRIVNSVGTVLAFATIRGLSKHGNRLEIIEDLLKGDPRVGTQLELSKFQNPD